MIPGIIYIGKQTYGHIKKGKDNVPLYKAKPCKKYKKEYKEILLPFKKKCEYNFDKTYNYYYILIDYNNKRIDKTIGLTTNYEAFVMYQFFVYNIKIPKDIKIKGTKNVNEITDKNEIYTIDNILCKDMDDGYAINKNELSIYITDPVTFLIENNMVNILNNITNYQTIYIPDNIKNMLPEVISNDYCSLLEGMKRNVIKLRIVVEDMKILLWEFSKEVVLIKNNKTYENCGDNLSKFLNKYMGVTLNNYESIEYIMILFNKYTAEYLDDCIYRVNINNRGIYTYDKIIHSEFNSLYTHATSPIRRYIDLYNINKILNKMNGTKMIINEISLDKINENQRYIKKIEKQCTLLYYNDKIVKCKVLKKIDKNKYLIDIYNYNLMVKLDEDNIIINKEYKIKIYIYEQEETFDKKFKIIIINEE